MRPIRQNVEPDVLRMLPKLACFDQLENGTNVGLQFMLTGGSELRELLNDDDFEEVREAIARRYELRFFTREELKYFLEKRLAPLARLTPEPITEEAINTVGKFTGGSPRLMGMICSHAMLFAAENPGRSIDEAMIEEAAEALMIEPIENPFAHEDDRDAELSGPFSSAEIRGDAMSNELDVDDHFGIEADNQETNMPSMDAPIAPSVDDSYDDESLFEKRLMAITMNGWMMNLTRQDRRSVWAPVRLLPESPAAQCSVALSQFSRAIRHPAFLKSLAM